MPNRFDTDPFDARRPRGWGVTGVAAYKPGGIPIPRQRTEELRSSFEEDFGEELPPANYLNDPHAPAIGPAALDKVGPMRIGGYGPGMLRERGPAFTMAQNGPGFMAGRPGPGGGYGPALRGMMGGMGPPGGMTSPLQATASGPFAPDGQGGMHPLEKAYLVAAGIGAVGDLYGTFQEGRARDRELERQEREDEREEERKKSGGRVFGEMFRRAYGM